MAKEVGLGLALAGLLFMYLNGYDVTPLLFLGAAGAGLYYIARSRGLLARHFVPEQPVNQQEVSFADIGGQASAIQELREALDFIKNYHQIKKLGIRPLKGILLTGPPGTGKTLLARAAASYTDAVFIACNGSEFIEVYAGVGAQRVRRLFQTAREAALRQGKKNALIFIDEIDILGARRGTNASHHEYDQTLNQLLVEMDGLKVDDRVRVLVVAATNRPDMLDPALLRPGRFDRLVRVDLPDRQGRLEILRLHTRNKPLGDDVSLEELAKETFGFSGAHLESLANEAAILAMREGSEVICQRHFQEAVEKVMMGERLDRRPSAEELRRVAVHEAGHALVSELVKPGSVSSLTITPRGQALGYMRQVPEDDPYLHTREYLENQVAVMLAGAVAEELVLGSRSTGAGGDFQEAARVAEQMIKNGMSSLGVVDAESLPRGLRYRAITEILRGQEERVRRFLSERKELLEKVVEALLEKERISGEEFRRLVS
ncbi:AAA family ATPase [Desulfovirgula thermocuniculi]|uniref:AAA family ATPase n=1 Tax=Desulfovirgula thermocuniculi TaxID=348842 RepID=UPI00040496B6|nr:AAA family ATPase [Desulfovirgula thermocuniculi]